MHTINTSGATLHYADSGAQERPPICFANSLGTDLRLWNCVANQMSDNFRCIRWDKRGHGLSTPKRFGPVTISEHVDDLLAILDHLAIERTTVVGISIGGMIAIDLTHRHPDRVSAAVLACTAPQIGTPEMWNERIAAVEASGVESIADGILERWLPESFRAVRQAELSAWRAMLCATTANGYAASCAAIRDANLTAATAQLRRPVLCIAGELDPVTPPTTVRDMSLTIRQAEYVEIPNSGHLPPIDAPEQFSAAVAAFATRSAT